MEFPQFSVLSGIIHSALDEAVITENDSRSSGYESTNAYYDKSEGRLTLFQISDK